MKKISIVIKKDEERTIPIVWTSGSGEISVHARLVGRGAKLNLIAAFFLANKDEVTFDVNIEHAAPDTNSDTLIKSVLTDTAVGKFYGMIIIKKGAKNTDTYFREDALLLSDTAKAEAIPSLEIDENEVKAGHASTVGPVDPEQLFYLQSRGITLKEAKSHVVRGFLYPVSEKLPEKEKTLLEKVLQKQLNKEDVSKFKI